MSLSDVKVKVSQLRCLVNIYAPTRTSDGMGGETVSYSSPTQAWAMIQDWRGRENYRAERTEGLVSHIIAIRAGIALADNNVIVYQGRYFSVKYVQYQDDGAVRYQIAFAIEGDPIGYQGSLS